MYTIQKGDKKMDTNFEVNMNEYLPLRDVVFNTLRQAILRGELKPRAPDGDSACKQIRGEPYSDSGGNPKAGT